MSVNFSGKYILRGKIKIMPVLPLLPVLDEDWWLINQTAQEFDDRGFISDPATAPDDWGMISPEGSGE